MIHTSNWDLHSQYGRTPLVWASASGLTDVVLSLIIKGIAINITDNVSRHNKRTLICILDSLWMYIFYNQLGHCPLSLACARGHSDVAELLINKGASVDILDKVSFIH